LRASAIRPSIVGGVSGSSRAKRTEYVCYIHERYDALPDSVLERRESRGTYSGTTSPMLRG
jgi:hypothetical protein